MVNTTNWKHLFFFMLGFLLLTTTLSSMAALHENKRALNAPSMSIGLFDNDSPSITNETWQIQFYKSNTSATWNDTIHFTYAFQAIITSNTIFQVTTSFEFYYANPENKSLIEYIGRIFYYRYLPINQSTSLSIELDVPVLNTGFLGILVHVVNHDNTLNLSSDTSRLYYSSLQKHPFLTSLTYYDAYNVIDFDNDNETDYVKLTFQVNSQQYNLSPLRINLDGSQVYPSFTLTYRIYEYDPAKSCTNRLVISHTTYASLNNYPLQPIEYVFFPGVQGFYLVNVSVSIFGIHVHSWGDMFYTSRSKWFYDQPYTFTPTPLDTDQDQNIDTIQFSLECNPSNELLAQISFDVFINVYYYNESTAHYDYLKTIDSYLSPSITSVHNQVITAFTASMPGQYLFNISMYDDTTQYIITQMNYTTRLSASLVPFAYFTWGVNSWYQDLDSSLIGNEVLYVYHYFSMTFEKKHLVSNVTILYDVYANSSNELELIQETTTVFNNTDEYSVSFSDEYYCEPGYYGSYAINISVILDGNLSSFTTLSFILIEPPKNITIISQVYAYGVIDTDHDGLSDSFEIQINIDLRDTELPVNLTLLAVFMKFNNDTQTYELFKTVNESIEFTVNDITFWREYQIGVLGQYTAMFYWVSEEKTIFITDANFTLQDNEINLTTTTTTITTSTPLNTTTTTDSTAPQPITSLPSTNNSVSPLSLILYPPLLFLIPLAFLKRKAE